MDSRPGQSRSCLLSDFGLSKGILSVRLTRAGQFLGTPGYAAPEQVGGRPVDGRADQYSLACVGFGLLTGEPLFEVTRALRPRWWRTCSSNRLPSPRGGLACQRWRTRCSPRRSRNSPPTGTGVAASSLEPSTQRSAWRWNFLQCLGVGERHSYGDFLGDEHALRVAAVTIVCAGPKVTSLPASGRRVRCRPAAPGAAANAAQSSRPGQYSRAGLQLLVPRGLGRPVEMAARLRLLDLSRAARRLLAAYESRSKRRTSRFWAGWPGRGRVTVICRSSRPRSRQCPGGRPGQWEACDRCPAPATDQAVITTPRP